MPASEREAGGHEVYEYKVIEVREGLAGEGAMSGDTLQDLLNEHSRDGWRLVTITPAQVRGRLGPAPVDGVLVTLERAAG